MRDQQDLIEETEWDWLVITDAGRADTFGSISGQYFSPSWEPVYNGGHTFTGTWFAQHLAGSYPGTLYHGGLPIYAFENNPEEYDERDHFAEVIEFTEYPWDNRVSTCPPEEVVGVVRDHPRESGVIRFLQPHNPYRTLLDTHGEGQASRYDRDALEGAYRDNYEWVLGVIEEDLLPLLSGRVVITSDHGQCFGDCGQYLHNLGHEPHEHLTTVPWMDLGEL